MEDILGKFKLVLGLEIHLHLITEHKMFCRCSSNVYGKEPNTNTCPVCLGLPGALPVPNFEAVRKTQLVGLAFNCEINTNSRFDRKHYFYPDLPKGYQISQYKQPLCIGGYIELSNGFRAEMERIHLEEDTAKSMHEGGRTLVDYNMSSLPLVEIVTKPVFTSVEDAVEFCKKVQETVRELGLGTLDMEKGQMRLEPNISLRTEEMENNSELPPYKVEIKNINSFRFMEKAVYAEVKRQRKMLEEGKTPVQENRGYDEDKKTTVSQRSKEQAHDYRYFPEPDIPPMVFDEAYLTELRSDFEKIKSDTPHAKKIETLKKIQSTSSVVLEEKITQRLLQELEISQINIILALVEKGHSPDKAAKLYLNRPGIKEMSFEQVDSLLSEDLDKLKDEDLLTQVVMEVLDNNKDAVESYRKGKENALQFLVGMVMRQTRGKADAETSKSLLLQQINKQ